MDPITVKLFVQLIAEVGLPAALQLRQWYLERGHSEITDADLAALGKLNAYRSTDALTAAGIQIVDGKVVPISK